MEVTRLEILQPFNFGIANPEERKLFYFSSFGLQIRM